MSPEEKKAIQCLQAVSDPTRLRTIELLFKGPQTVTDIANKLGVSIVNTSHHLGVLRTAGIVLDEKKGRFVTYRLNQAVVDIASRKLNFRWCVVEVK